MRIKPVLTVALFSMVWAAGKVFAQAAQPPATEPIVTYAFDFAEARPSHYEFIMDGSGRTAYKVSEAAPAEETEPQVRELTFTMSAATRERILALIKATKYLDGEFDYTKSKIAESGKKTLSYTNGPLRRRVTFNWSENPAIRELSETFNGISVTIEFGFRLRHLRRYDKLGLEAELKKMEERSKGGWIKELQLVSEVLHDIAVDSSIMGVARRRAERLLALAGPQSN